MKSLALLLLLVSAVVKAQVGYPFQKGYTSNCESINLLKKREFIRISSLIKVYDTDQQINNIICYKGSETLEILVSEKEDTSSNSITISKYFV